MQSYLFLREIHDFWAKIPKKPILECFGLCGPGGDHAKKAIFDRFLAKYRIFRIA